MYDRLIRQRRFFIFQGGCVTRYATNFIAVCGNLTYFLKISRLATNISIALLPQHSRFANL